MGIHKKRKEMGEELWAEYVRKKNYEKQRKWMKNNNEEYKKKNKDRSDYLLYIRNTIKNKLIEIKGGKCEMCGYDKKIPSSYSFHHRDPKNKDFGISDYMHLEENLPKLIEEIKKCDLLCCRCHAEVHYELMQDRRVDAFERYTNEVKVNKKATVYSIKCLYCSKKIETKQNNQRYCSNQCRSLACRKIKERPSKEDLKKN